MISFSIKLIHSSVIQHISFHSLNDYKKFSVNFHWFEIQTLNPLKFTLLFKKTVF